MSASYFPPDQAPPDPLAGHVARLTEALEKSKAAKENRDRARREALERKLKKRLRQVTELKAELYDLLVSG